MSLRALTLWCLAAALSALFAFPVRAQLTAHSPFLPPAALTNAAPSEQKLQFAGYLSGPCGREFVVLDATRKSRAWLHLNERIGDLDIVAKHYDEANETLTVEHGGGVQVLPLRRATNVSLKLPPLPARAVTSAGSLPVPVPMGPGHASAAEQLAQTRAELERRRALREAATRAGVALPPNGPITTSAELAAPPNPALSTR